MRSETNSIRNSTHATAARVLHRRSAGCIIEVAIMKTAVGIAQLAEHRTVAPTVAGSIPVSHPRIFLLRCIAQDSSSFIIRALWRFPSNKLRLEVVVGMLPAVTPPLASQIGKLNCLAGFFFDACVDRPTALNYNRSNLPARARLRLAGPVADDWSAADSAPLAAPSGSPLEVMSF